MGSINVYTWGQWRGGHLSPPGASPSQMTARKVIRKYNTSSRMFGGQKKELTSLRQSLPHMKTASDLDLVLEAISYIQQLQQKLLAMSEGNNQNNKPDPNTSLIL